MSYQQLNLDERFELYRLQQSGALSIRAIARQMGRSHSTLSRELRRHQTAEQSYRPDKAQLCAQIRRQQAKIAFKHICEQSVGSIKQRLGLYHSPEQIAGALKRLGQAPVSHETIYQMIYQDHAQMGAYKKYLRQARPKRRKRSGKHSKRGVIPNRVGIEQRPAVAAQKREVGHWEGDTVIGAAHSGAIATYVDKASKYLVARVMPNRTAEVLNEFTIRAFKVIGIERRKTMTFDNGKEFSGHEELAKVLKVSCYFANPYHSWERGLNEHTNGLLRQFFPKGTDFKEVKQKDVDEAVKLINHRPRKALDYRTPHEVFWGQSGSGALQN
jgi:transposase, IS30 family